MSGPAAGTVAVLFALEREATPFRRVARELPHVSVHVSGVGRNRARRAAEQLLATSDPGLVIAAGFCGALQHGIRIGDVCVSEEVVDVNSRTWIAADRYVRDRLSVRMGRVFTSDRLIFDPAEKRHFGEWHQADVVDMESAAVAEVCAGKGVPFLAVRAVSDTVDTALSPELVRLLAGGNVSVWKAVAALVRRPRLLGEFRRLARDTRLASRTLADALAAVINSPRAI